MSRQKKEVQEAEFEEVKKTKKDSTKKSEKQVDKKATKKTTSASKKSVDKQDKSEEKVVVEKIIDKKEKKYQPAYFFPRLIAYILDMIIVSFVLSFILMIVPQSDNYNAYLKEYEQLQTDYMEEKIDAEEYMNRSIEVVHDLDYSNVMSMIIELVIIILYFVVFQCYNKGQTLGKKLMHIRVISNDDRKLNFNNYIYRSIIIHSLLINMLIIAMVLFMNKQIYYYTSFGLQGLQMTLIVVSLFMVLFRKDGRGIQDLVGNTKVIMCDEE